jgi:hypothetical protein
MRAFTLLALAGAIAFLMPRVAWASDDEIELILDCSGSMTDPVDGRPKIHIAKQCLGELLDSLPEGSRVGLRAYGHHGFTTKTTSCNDTELLVPIGPLDKRYVKEKVGELRCHGMTPIAHSLEVASGDFGTGEIARTIVLLTDGLETCGGDPVAVVERLKAQGFQFTMQVIGFDVSASERGPLERLAKAGGGRYYSAHSAIELERSLQGAVGGDAAEIKPVAPPEPPKVRVADRAAKNIFYMDGFFRGCPAELLAEEGEQARIKTSRGALRVPRYLCFPRKRIHPEELVVGREVLAEIADRGTVERVQNASVVEVKANKFRVAFETTQVPERWVEASQLYERAVVEEGQRVDLSIVRESHWTCFGREASVLVEPSLPVDGVAFEGDVDVTLKVLGGNKSIGRVGWIAPANVYNSDDHCLPLTVDIYVGSSASEPFWHAVGRVTPEVTHNWQFVRFPSQNAEFVHLHVQNRGSPFTAIGRIRAYADEGPGTLALGPIPDPKPPIGAAGELERKSTEILVAEGTQFRRAKLLKKSAEQVLAIAADGRKLVLDPAQTPPAQPVDIAKLQLGDDVLLSVDDRDRGLLSRGVVTEIATADKIKVQVGAREFVATPDLLIVAPAAQAPVAQASH